MFGWPWFKREPTMDEIVANHIANMTEMERERAAFERNIRQTAEQVYREFVNGPFHRFMGGTIYGYSQPDPTAPDCDIISDGAGGFTRIHRDKETA
jgi:hypothetical protein